MRPILALTSLLLLAPGCGTLGGLQTSPEAAQIVVQQATLRFVGQDAERAQKVAETASQLQALVNAEPVSVDALERQAAQAILAADLSPADQHLAQSLVRLVGDELRARVGDGTIPPPGTVEAEAVLGWVAEAALWVPAE